MHDLPTGPALLALARDVLLNDLIPLLPKEARPDGWLVADSMAIAEREAVAGESPEKAILRELTMFYGDATVTHPLSRTPGGGPERSEGGEGQLELLRRFARDLRAGAFEGSGRHSREARAILWRLTIFKLRQANPRFLAANGIS
jgi:Domain of unknown function (DUF6285)